MPETRKVPLRRFQGRVLLLLFLLPIVNHEAEGQKNSIHANSNEAIHQKRDTIVADQKDVRDVLGDALKIKRSPDSLRMKGDGPFLSIIPIVGYSMMSGVTGVISTSTSFYTGDERNRFSNILFNAYYSQFNQFWTIANSNVFFEKSKLHLLGDWRFYKFPTNTYGIGSSTTGNDALEVQYNYVRFYQILYREITSNFFAGVGYNLDYHWNIKEMPPEGSVYDEIVSTGNGDRSVSSGFSLNIQYDTRVNPVNPMNGTMVSLQLRQNLTSLGSDKDWQSLLLDFRQFVNLPAWSDNVLAFWSYDNLTLSGEPPYFDLPSTGWDSYNNTGRGYVPGRFTGKNFIYAETEYRMVLSRNGIFGGVIFANAESVFQNISRDNLKLLPGAGFGIRIKVNKNSGVNLALDYGFGTDGSRGLFVNLGEVF